LMAVYSGDDPEYFRECLASLLIQTLQADEIIVVCDGPIAQNLESIFSEFKNLPLTVLRYRGKHKLPGALNMGLKAASHDIVARMDADDICAANRFAIQVPVFSEQKLTVLGSSIHEFRSDPDHALHVRRVKQSLKKSDFYFRNPMNHMTVVFSKKAVLEIGGYHFIEGFEDWHLWLRLNKQGKQFGNLIQPLVFARIGNGFIQRRSGVKYALREVKAYLLFFGEELIPFRSLLAGLLIRSPIRLLPTTIQQKIYSTIREPIK
jgi:glycosyltransferase involved in cell wall biosynthesis